MLRNLFRKLLELTTLFKPFFTVNKVKIVKKVWIKSKCPFLYEGFSKLRFLVQLSYSKDRFKPKLARFTHKFVNLGVWIFQKYPAGTGGGNISDCLGWKKFSFDTCFPKIYGVFPIYFPQFSKETRKISTTLPSFLVQIFQFLASRLICV